MSHKVDGMPPPAAIRATGPLGGQVDRAGDAREKAIEAPAAGDSLRLTGEATGLQALQRELAANPAMDMAKVEAVREAIAAGNYKIDAEAIAGRMLDLDAQLYGK